MANYKLHLGLVFSLTYADQKTPLRKEKGKPQAGGKNILTTHISDKAHVSKIDKD